MQPVIHEDMVEKYNDEIHRVDDELLLEAFQLVQALELDIQSNKDRKLGVENMIIEMDKKSKGVNHVMA